MHVRADQNICATSGQCAESVPEVFGERDEDGVVVVVEPHPPARLWHQVRDAARRCPVAAISLVGFSPAVTMPQNESGAASEVATSATVTIHDRISELRALMWPELKNVVDQLPTSLRDVASYQFGWNDEKVHPTSGSPGKLIHAVLVLLCAQAAGGHAEQALPAAVAVELVHNFSLLHDDAMDGDVLSRHHRTVLSAFGTRAAILLSDALLVLTFKRLASVGHADTTMLCDALLEMLEGQHRGLTFEERGDIVVDDGVAVALRQSSALLAYACRLGTTTTGADEHRAEYYEQFGKHLGSPFNSATTSWEFGAIRRSPANPSTPIYELVRRLCWCWPR
jgi:ferredoxin